ncbi:MAG TPA: hypothetical protein VNA69_09800 [Thermoanaerobaculia bacterium]|nr:hypothetical protein [Thermoanaerobaculia bacterium]
MPGPLYHASAAAICPHGGQVTVIPSAPRVLVSGLPVATMSDTTLVAGCAFTVPGPKPQPCIRVQWLVPATRILVNGQPALLQTSTGLCFSPESIPQGPPQILTTQTRVMGM